jgi:predicted RNase H-like HicB family nuclease
MASEGSGHIRLTFKAYREGKQWVSECLELGTASCGDTIEQAFDALDDATLLYLQTLEDEGERARVFNERGIDIIPGPPDTSEAPLSIPMRPHEVVSPHEMAIPAGMA